MLIKNIVSLVDYTLPALKIPCDIHLKNVFLSEFNFLAKPCQPIRCLVAEKGRLVPVDVNR